MRRVYDLVHAPEGLPRSPMHTLARRVVEIALAEGVQTVDLGISSVPAGGARVADHGLVQFKRSVLARSEPRLVLVRDRP